MLIANAIGSPKSRNTASKSEALLELLGLNPLLEDATRGHYAVGAFNYVNAEIAQGVAEAASELRSPIIMITGPGDGPLLGAKMLVQIARWVANEVDVPICLHLDHAKDIATVEECIEAGFPSVMMDASRFDFEENVRLTRLVVDMARPRGVTVEGELGAVGRVDDSTVEGAGEASLTDPQKAAEFAERTGVDALAVAIGNAHGMYKQRPVLDFERLEAIRAAITVPLVLHGGSGTAPDQLRRAIDIGISKVNVASEIGRAYLAAIRGADDAHSGKVWYPCALADAKAAVRDVTARWIRQLGSEGMAGGDR